ncbi:MAG: SufS family cysteine desulfurase [Alphaproteobacteria bacterium]|nr:SufS family cysteine desulfurase [Alphaproteobacteria bacterium]
MFDVEKLRCDFPALSVLRNKKRIIFLDSAASAQKPKIILDKMNYVYQHEYANVHRGMYYFSERATELYEDSRKKIQKFINAKEVEEIIFTKGATNSINLVAYTWAEQNLTDKDNIIITRAEHHSNIVPWQIMQKRKNFKIKVAEVDDDGNLDIEYLKNLVDENTKLICCAQVSNVLGTIFPVKEITKFAHNHSIKVLVDGCQSTPHMAIDVQDLDCDFYAFSGHKIYGPTGVGVLYGKKEILENMAPFEGGGDMIKNVSFSGSTWADIPARFEAGTPMIVQAIGLGYAIDYISLIGMADVYAEDRKLLKYMQDAIEDLKDFKILGKSTNKIAVVSFVPTFTHPQDLAMILDQEGICVRTGHHCAQPLHEKFCTKSSVRASLGVYSDKNDVDALISSLHKAKKFFI